MEDREIVELYHARNEQAIEASREKYGAYCRAIAYNILRSGEDAEECESDTYLKAWCAIPPARPVNLGAFLGRICRNAALNMLEKYSAQKRCGSETESAARELAYCLASFEEELVDRMQLCEILNRFLASLRPDARRIFMRRYWYFSSVGEIARDFSMGESRVKMSLSRSRRALRRLLEKEGVEI